MSVLDRLQAGIRLYDNRTGAERLVHDVERVGQVVFLSFKHPQTGELDRQPFSASEVESRFEVIARAAWPFAHNPI